jgi:hypothetical protein
MPRAKLVTSSFDSNATAVAMGVGWPQPQCMAVDGAMLLTSCSSSNTSVGGTALRLD